MNDWQDLDFDEITEWPRGPQSVVALLLSLVVVAVGYWYWLTPLQAELAQLKQTEVELRSRVINRASQVAALPTVKQQIDELNKRYQTVIVQLPVERELASLLSDINDIGVNNGLEFQGIQWADRIEKAQYHELPLNMQLTGNYEQIGQFAASIAHLPRIVTLKNVDLKVTEHGQNKNTLSLKVSASTYRFKGTPEKVAL
ncbi:type 4a pilus biogenesis protein PilO [Photobacterium indicum]|uniref:Fimbrial protein n=1 Tax=Photobacterium indicum TaxID=81447 RepID=A0A2T3L6K5_9GAMM|nr:type 4a pilus biogenesis protein PilO [Photobacterium indicum]PSV45756.1 fimbrial protein [Photobacterium indicum]